MKEIKKIYPNDLTLIKELSILELQFLLTRNELFIEGLFLNFDGIFENLLIDSKIVLNLWNDNEQNYDKILTKELQNIEAILDPIIDEVHLFTSKVRRLKYGDK